MKIGDFLDNTYEIKEYIGKGGNTKIYKAYHIRLGKYVVIKQIKADSEISLYQRKEVDILKNLKHAYLPQVYDFIKCEDSVYTVLEYITGNNLLEVLEKKKKFPEKKIIKWSIQLLDAVQYLHTREIPIIHGDIKPSNIMLTYDDNICLIDFNVSGFLNDKTTLNGFTEGYAPPEKKFIFNYVERMMVSENSNDEFSSNHFGALSCLKSGRPISNICTKPYNPDMRSDIFSIGATIYHLLTGNRPILYDVDYENKYIKKHSMKINGKLRKIIRKSMNQEPDLRYKSAEEMKDDLMEISIKKGIWDKFL